ncbi:hypothetical protein Hanom_Chr17g01536371 [Helianthus anomalus]
MRIKNTIMVRSSGTGPVHVDIFALEFLLARVTKAQEIIREVRILDFSGFNRMFFTLQRFSDKLILVTL